MQLGSQVDGIQAVWPVIFTATLTAARLASSSPIPSMIKTKAEQDPMYNYSVSD